MKDTHGLVSSATSQYLRADNATPLSCRCSQGISITSEVSFGGAFGAPGNALPVLYQVLAMAEALLASGQTDSLDLGGLPLSPQELDAVKRI